MIEKILLIDIPELSIVVQRMLKMNNTEYQISLANSLEEASLIVKHSDFDLIMIDPYCKKEQTLKEIVQFLDSLDASIMLLDISSEGCPEHIQKKFHKRFPKPFLLTQLQTFMKSLDESDRH